MDIILYMMHFDMNLKAGFPKVLRGCGNDFVADRRPGKM